MAKNVRILIVENTQSRINAYVSLIDPLDFHCALMWCNSGANAQAMIDEGQEKFDLVITEVILPVENRDSQAVTEYAKTGIRLIRKMIQKQMCNTFYIITLLDRDTVAPDIEAIRKHFPGTTCICENKFAFDDVKFRDTVTELLGKSLTPAGKGLMWADLDSYVDTIESMGSVIDRLEEDDESRIVTTLGLTEDVLRKLPRESESVDVVLRLKRALDQHYRNDDVPRAVRLAAERIMPIIITWLQKEAD